MNINVISKTYSHLQQSSIISSIKKFGKTRFSANGKDNDSIAASVKFSAEGRRKIRSLSDDSVEKLEENYYAGQKEQLKKDRDELISILDQLKKDYSSITDSTRRKMTKETEMDRIEAEEQLRQLKEEQEALYASREKDAQKISEQVSKGQLNQQRGYADLYVIEKSLEDSEEEDSKVKRTDAEAFGEEDKDGLFVSSEEEEGIETSDILSSISSGITKIALDAEKRMDATIQRMTDKYKQRMDKVDAFTYNFMEALNDAYKICDDERYTNDQKLDAIKKFSNFSMDNMMEIQEEKAIALEIKHNVDNIKLSRQACNNMEIANRYADKVQGLTDWVEKLDYMKEYVEEIQANEEEFYKDAIKETKENETTIDENKPADEENSEEDEILDIIDYEKKQ